MVHLEISRGNEEETARQTERRDRQRIEAETERETQKGDRPSIFKVFNSGDRREMKRRKQRERDRVGDRDRDTST